MPRKLSLGWSAAFLSFLLILSFWWRTAPAVFSDPAYGLLAAMQYEKGNSPSIFHMRQAKSSNLSEDVDRKVTFWAPSYQLPPFLFKKAGLSWGGAIKATFLFSFFLGLIGWLLYFKRFFNGEAFGFFVAVFCLLRFSHSNVWIYDGGELLLGAVFPWVLLANLHAMKSSRLFIAWLVGALSSTLYLVKYSGLLYTIGIGLAWSYYAYKHKKERLRFLVWGLGAASTLLFILVCVAPLTGTSAGATGSASPLWSLWYFTAISLAMTDLFSVVLFIFQHPSRPLVGEEIMWVSLPLTCFMGYLVWIGRAKKTRPSDSVLEKEVALTIAISIALGLMLLTLKGGFAFIDGRHHRHAAIALMPFLWLAVTGKYQKKKERFLSTAGLVLFFLLPAIYGFAIIVEKGWFRMPVDGKYVGSLGIRLPNLNGASDAKAFYEEVRSRAGRDALLYIPAPELALELADRRIILEDADFTSIELLSNRERHGLPEGGILLVLPTGFDKNGKTSVIQATFKDVRSWKTQSMASAPGWNLHFSSREK